MKGVFDTNILIDYLNGVDDAAKELALFSERAISVITRIEVLVGTQIEEENPVRSFLAGFKVLHVTPEIGEIAVLLRKEHGLRVPDAIVYATARKEGCLLISRNTKDFKESWPDIRVPYQLT